MFEEIKNHNELVKAQILGGFSNAEDLMEKGKHQVGEVKLFSDGIKRVWTLLPNGKYDWRRVKKNKAAQQEPAKQDSSNQESTKQESTKQDSAKQKVDNSTPQNKTKLPESFEDAVKIGKVDENAVNDYKIPSSIYGLKSELESVTGKGGYNGKVDYATYRLKTILNEKVGNGFGEFRTEEEKLKSIQDASNELSTSKAIEKKIKNALSKLKKERDNFLENAKDTFTEKEVEEWINKYRNSYDSAAVVSNRWNYYMGRIGSTSATISVGKGKEKPLVESNFPNWRPIGMLEYIVPNLNHSDYIQIKRPIQSWRDVQSNLDSTENFKLLLFKHPKQY